MLHPRIALWSPLVLPATLLILYLSYNSNDPLPEAPPHEPPLPKVHLFVPINEAAARREKGFCRTMQGAIVNGWQPIIFNWDVQSSYQKKKVQGLARILASANHTTDIDETDLIFTMDALDIWLQLSPDVVARRFLEYNVDILVAAEKNCFPNVPQAHDCVAAPESPMLKGLYRFNDEEGRPLSPEEKAPRHANSGTVVGRAKEMQEFYVGLWEFMNSDRYDGYDDQAAFNMLLSDGYLDLDYYTRLFWPGHDDYKNMEFLGTRYPPDPSIAASSSNQPGSPSAIPWDLYPPLGHHTLHGEVPVALHFNGGSKHLVDEWWGRLWWASDRERFRDTIRSRMDEGRVRFVTDEGYREETIRELCPLLDLWQWDASQDDSKGYQIVV